VSDRPIPFNRAFIAGNELAYIAQAVANGNVGADGAFTNQCCRWMEEHFGARRALLTPSCTSALEIAAVLCELEPGDEVIVPSFTFVSTASAFLMTGCRLRFVDIRPDTLNMDVGLLPGLIGARTRVIVPMHYAGAACAMDDIMALADRHDLLVVEDAAQAVGAEYRGRHLGTIGHLGCFSFHETKNLICGEGGALLVNDRRFEARADIVRHGGTNRSQFLRGEVDQYTWVDVGSSHLPSEMVAAFLYAQFEAFERITARRHAIHRRYDVGLAGLRERGCLRTPAPTEARHNAHMFYVLLEDGHSRDALMKWLRASGIHAVFHYVPLHTSPMGRRMGYACGDLPVTEAVSARLLRLPCYYELEPSDQDRVIDAIHEFFNRR